MIEDRIINFRPDLTRESVLQQVSEEEIFAAYGVPVVDYPFRSPLRRDTRPTCQFYRRRRDNRLVMHDHSGHFWGDCFDLVMKIHPKMTFWDALRHIVDNFSTPGKIAAAPIVIISQLECKIRVKRGEWTKAHYDYWMEGGITPETLDKFEVYPLDRAWLNDEQCFSYEVRKEIGFCYWFGGYDYKLYFPTRSRTGRTIRFIHNNPNILQGYEHLPESGDHCIITKSLKDVMAMYEFGIVATAPMSENQILSETTQGDLTDRFGNLFSLYDLDETGIRSMKSMRKKGIQPLFFPRNNPKDFFDYRRTNGYEHTRITCEMVRDLYF